VEEAALVGAGGSVVWWLTVAQWILSYPQWFMWVLWAMSERAVSALGKTVQKWQKWHKSSKCCEYKKSNAFVILVLNLHCERARFFADSDDVARAPGGRSGEAVGQMQKCA
jgi:hypothetical protein